MIHILNLSWKGAHVTAFTHLSRLQKVKLMFSMTWRPGVNRVSKSKCSFGQLGQLVLKPTRYQPSFSLGSHRHSDMNQRRKQQTQIDFYSSFNIYNIYIKQVFLSLIRDNILVQNMKLICIFVIFKLSSILFTLFFLFFSLLSRKYSPESGGGEKLSQETSHGAYFQHLMVNGYHFTEEPSQIVKFQE